MSAAAILRAVLLAAATLAAPWVQAASDLAQALRPAQQALAAGDYDGAYPRYLHAAEDGNPLAQFTVALYHQMGWGSRPVDPAEACRWFERSAAGDIPTAAHYLGECYERGVGRPADPAAAARWYARAAELGHHSSLCALGDLHMHGRGVAKDPAKALALCREAAEKGAAPARVQVGRYLLEGDESIRDVEAARAWFEAAAAVSPQAQYYLGVMHRDGIGYDPSPGDARVWFERAASAGYVPAYFPTARLYFEVSPDYTTRPPPADDLAKAYMWLSATGRRSTDPRELEQTGAMLEQVRAIMPGTWAPTLDERVEAHLAEHPPIR